MGFFGNIINGHRHMILSTAYDTIVIPQLNLIEQRQLSGQLAESVQSYFDDAINSAKITSINGQIKAAKASVLTAFSIKDQNIIQSCSLYLVAIYVEIYCTVKNEPNLFYSYAPLEQALENTFLRCQCASKMREFRSIVGQREIPQY